MCWLVVRAQVARSSALVVLTLWGELLRPVVLWDHISLILTCDLGFALLECPSARGRFG